MNDLLRVAIINGQAQLIQKLLHNARLETVRLLFQNLEHVLFHELEDEI